VKAVLKPGRWLPGSVYERELETHRKSRLLIRLLSEIEEISLEGGYLLSLGCLRALINSSAVEGRFTEMPTLSNVFKFPG